MTSVTGARVIETVSDLRNWRARVLAEKNTASIALVPTMGALHDGHLTLIRKAVQNNDYVVVSIFVNPLQFGPNEDFNRYPRAFQRDLELCTQAGAHVVFHPTVEEMYRGGLGITNKVVPPPELTEKLCGLFRPGHFTGVATVVLKLFNMVQPHTAYFGEKDFQQLAVIKAMVNDLDVPLLVVPVSTVRERDGLAMSSRNTYLSPEQRTVSVQLYQTLRQVKDNCAGGIQTLPEALAAGAARINSIPECQLQYLQACDPLTLEQLDQWRLPAVILVAAKLGSVRLIDNLIVE